MRIVLFFCQHCALMEDCDIDDGNERSTMRDIAKDECKLSPTKTHILSAVVLPDKNKNSSPTIASAP